MTEQVKWTDSIKNALAPAIDVIKRFWGYAVIALAAVVAIVILIPKRPKVESDGVVGSTKVKTGNDAKIKEANNAVENANEKAKQTKKGQPTPSTFEEADAALEAALKKAQKVSKIEIPAKKGSKK